MRNRSASATLTAAIVLLGAAPPVVAEHHVRVHPGADLGVGYDDNVGSAAIDTDTRDSVFVSAGLNLDYSQRLGSTTGLLLRGSVRGDAYDRTEALTNGKLGGMVRLAYRPQGGFYAPVLAGWFSAALWEFDSAMRDGAEFRAGVYVAEPLTTALSARVSLQASERVSDSPVFDLSAWSAGLNIDWNVLGFLTAYGGYQFHDGHLVSSGSVYPKSHEPEPGDDRYRYGPDDALDGLTAYRVNAQTSIGVLGVNRPVSESLSLDAQLQVVESETDYGIGYSRMIGVVSALMRF